MSRASALLPLYGDIFTIYTGEGSTICLVASYSLCHRPQVIETQGSRNQETLCRPTILSHTLHPACAPEALSQEMETSSGACLTLIHNWYFTTHLVLSPCRCPFLVRSLRNVGSEAPKPRFQPLMCILAIVYLLVAQSVHFEKV